MSKDEKFNQIYKKILNENTYYMETARENAKAEKIRNYIILTVIIIIDVVIIREIIKLFGSRNISIDGNICGTLIGTLTVISTLIYEFIMKKCGESKINKYMEDYKTSIVGTMMKSFEEQLEFEPKYGLSSNVFREAEFEKFSIYYAEDLIHGILKNNCEFEMSEVLTKKIETDSNGHTKDKIIFNGLFAKIDTPKQFNTYIYIRIDRKDKDLLSRVILGKLPFDKLRIQLDSPEFEKIFDVYASDHIIAMQLLTADIMNDLMQFYIEMGMDYELTIKENHIYIRFWCGQMFETARLGKFSLDRDTLYKYYRMLEFMLDLTYKIQKVLYETQY